MSVFIYDKQKQRYLLSKDGAKAKFNSVQAARNYVLNNKPLSLKLEADKLDFVDEATIYTKEEADALVDSFCEAAQNFYSQISNLRNCYNNELSKIDKEQEDLLHKIEFENIVGIQNIQYIKMLKKIRIKRRNVKDEIWKLNILLMGQDIPNKLSEMNDRCYKPRVLSELFDGGNDNAGN